MTPFGQRPLDLGADIVVAADTKAPNGHSDVLFGHVASRDPDIIAAVTDWRETVRRHSRPVRSLAGASRPGNAGRALRPHVLFGRDDRAAAEEPSARCSGLRFPGLEGDPSHNLARAQMERFGFLICLRARLGGQGRGFHQQLRADAGGDLLRRRPHLGRAAGQARRRRCRPASCACRSAASRWKSSGRRSRRRWTRSAPERSIRIRSSASMLRRPCKTRTISIASSPTR